jgi:hypothetical protein
LGYDQHETDDQETRPDNHQVAVVGEQRDQQQSDGDHGQQAAPQQQQAGDPQAPCGGNGAGTMHGFADFQESLFRQTGLPPDLAIDVRPGLAGCLFGLIREEMQLPGPGREFFKCLQILTEVLCGFLWFRFHA